MAPYRIVVGLALALTPAALTAQALTGSYTMESPAGPVRLTLQQQGQALTGRMDAADGSVLQLDGVVESGRATGAIEVAGEVGWFAAGFEEGGQLLLVVAEIDPATGEPNLEQGWTLSFDRAAATGMDGLKGAKATPREEGAGALPYAGGGAAQGTGSQPGSASERPGGDASLSAEAREWVRYLSGQRLTYLSSSGSSSYGWSSQSSERWDAYVCGNGTFYFESSSSFAVGGQGATGYGGDSDALEGEWEIAEDAGQVYLRFRMEDGSSDVVPLRQVDGATYLGGQRVYVTPENPYCR